jgi:hypothetical protein
VARQIRVKAARKWCCGGGGFAKEDPAELDKAEKMLREFVAMEQDRG